MTAPLPLSAPTGPQGAGPATPGGSAARVVKLGGSLMGSDALDALLGGILAAPVPVVVVPGGGLFADAVRTAQTKLGFSDALAHRLALDAMGAFAEVLAERLADRGVTAPIDADASRAAAAARPGRPVLWTPAAWRDGAPGIPETWSLTSDSAALIVARTIAAPGLVLVKSAEPGADDGATAALPRDLVDDAFPSFLGDYAGIVRALGPSAWHRLDAALADPAAPIGRRVEPRDFTPADIARNLEAASAAAPRPSAPLPGITP